MTSNDDNDEHVMMIALALQNYDIFYSLKPGTATVPIVEHSSAGISGWASCVLQNNNNNYKYDSTISLTVPLRASNESRRAGRRKGDIQEDLQLQRALLESMGVDLDHDTCSSTTTATTTKETLTCTVMDQDACEEGSSSFFYYNDDHDESEADRSSGSTSVRWESDASTTSHDKNRTGLSVSMKDVYLDDLESESRPKSTLGGCFVLVNNTRHERTQEDSSKGRVSGKVGEISLSMLPQDAWSSDNSEHDSVDSTESFIFVHSRSPQIHHGQERE